MYVCIYAYMHACMHVLCMYGGECTPRSEEGISSTGTRIIDSCEPSNVSAGNGTLRSSARSVSVYS